LFSYNISKLILLDILAKVGRVLTANGAFAFVCVSTNEKCLLVWSKLHWWWNDKTINPKNFNNSL